MDPEKTPSVPELDLDALVSEYGQDPVTAPVETPPVETPPVEAPVAPPVDSTTELVARFEEREKMYQQTIDTQNSRMNTLETLVNQGYQAVHKEPPKPEVPTFTQEELLADPIGTMDRMSDAKAKAAITANNEQLSGVIGGLVERSWQGELSSLSGKRFYGQVKDEIDTMVTANPNLKLQPNSAELAYNMIVGRDIEKLIAGEPTTKTSGPVLVPAPAAPRTPVPVPNAGGPAPPAPPQETPPVEAPKLTEAQIRLQKRFAGLDIGLVASDFEGEK